MHKVMTVLSHMATGQTKSRACLEAGITVATFNKYARENQQIAELLDEAEDQGYDVLAEALLHIDTDPIYGTTDPQKMKVISDNIKWFLSKRRPKKYGEKLQIENTLTVDQTIVDMLMRGRDRALGVIEDKRDADDAEVIDADPYAKFY